MNKKTTSVLTVFILGFGLFWLSSSQTQADIKLITSERIGNILFASEDKKVFLSPDRTHIAVTFQQGEADVLTYLANLDGEKVTSTHPGSFVAWSPDSTKVLLYLAAEQTSDERQIFFLDLSGEYYKSDLPKGVISADISPADGSIVYALTNSQTDDTALYIRDPEGRDQLVVPKSTNILTWPRWTTDGEKIIFLESDTAGRPGNQNANLIDRNGTNEKEIASVQWGYPPMLSSDGSKFVFASSNDIWEFNIQEDKLTNITKGRVKFSKHPSYSSDGETIVFSNGKQIWSVRGDDIAQVTEGHSMKNYPLLP
jgi:Tol biopolymer transport system component